MKNWKEEQALLIGDEDHEYMVLKWINEVKEVIGPLPDIEMGDLDLGITKEEQGQIKEISENASGNQEQKIQLADYMHRLIQSIEPLAASLKLALAEIKKDIYHDK